MSRRTAWELRMRQGSQFKWSIGGSGKKFTQIGKRLTDQYDIFTLWCRDAAQFEFLIVEMYLSVCCREAT